MLSIETFTFNPFQENTYVLFDETREAIIIDPGCYERLEEKELSTFIEARQLKIIAIVNTHSHIDHILGVAYVKDKYKVPFRTHKIDEELVKHGRNVAQLYGLPRYTEFEVDSYIEEGVPVTFGNQSFDVLFVPGHAPGHVAFYHEKQNILMVGDVLFNRSIGRTDLPGGNYDTLIDSIHKKIFTLPDEVVVYPGHGPTTTVGEEKTDNPFCKII